MIDILIPLASESINDFLELRIALRSIDKCTNVGNVYVITTANIPWLSNAIVVPVEDTFSNNKDKNLIHKVEVTLERYDTIDDFMLWCDDFVALRPIDLDYAPDVYNKRGINSFNGYLTKWQARLKNTLEVGKIFGKDVSCNWDAHVPIKYNRSTILEGLKHIDYKHPTSNYTIYTLFGHLSNKTSSNAVLQDDVKCTCETYNYNLDLTKTYLGYNDKAFNAGLSSELLTMFNTESSFELDTIRSIMPIVVLAVNAATKTIDSLFPEGIHYNPIVMPLDEFSVSNIDNNKYSVVPIIATNCENPITKILSVASKLTNYAIVVDGSITYPRTYIRDSLKTIDNENVTVVRYGTKYIAIDLTRIDDFSIFDGAKTHDDFINTVSTVVPYITLAEQ